MKTRGVGIERCAHGMRWAWTLSILIAACGGSGHGEVHGDGAVEGGGGDASATDGGRRCAADLDCDDGLYCNGEELCAPAGSDADAMGCVAGGAPCAASETCDEARDMCLTDCDLHGDADGDGHLTLECGGDDCDDADANRYPGNVEVCDPGSHDEDCDPETFGFVDADMDGAGDAHCCNLAADGSFQCAGDCDDTNGSILPGAGDGPPAACDGLDNDCDGTADEGCPCVEGETRPCGASPAQIDGIGACEPGTQICSGGAFTEACVGGRAPAAEVCDGVDNDCDGTVDDGVLSAFYRDLDGDGFGVSGETTDACAPPAGWAANTLDCDDTNPSVSPAGTEVCDGADNNCNGLTDEGLLHTYYADADGDGFGDLASATTACFRPDGYADLPTDCDDTAAPVNPASPEICDRVDNDCDGAVDEGCSCVDGTRQACGADDGMGGVLTTGECAAGEQLCTGGLWSACVGAVVPVAESCNGLDDNCNGSVDETLKVRFYRDADGDGFGDVGRTLSACTEPPGYVRSSSDCDDGAAAINPAAAEICDSVDNDCDGTVDEDCACVDGRRRACGPRDGAGALLTTGVCQSGEQLCTGGLWGVCAGAVGPTAERCDGLDDDCDGTIDEGVTASCYADGDGDGYGTGALLDVCTDTPGTCPAGYAPANGDCNESNPAIHPGAVEVCDGADNDCDGTIDTDGAGECVQNSIVGCTTACGTSGTVSCDASCHFRAPGPSCAAPAEVCNYCDDNLDGSVADEHGLASATHVVQGICTDPYLVEQPNVALSGDATCYSDAGAGPNEHQYARLGPMGGLGAAWYGEPARFGYQGVMAEVTVSAWQDASCPVFEGFALLLATDTGTTFDSAQSLGVPMTRHGVAVEWRTNGSMPDTITLRQLTGAAPGTTVNETSIGTPVNFDPPAGGTVRLDAQLRLRWTPADTTLRTAERLEIDVLDPVSGSWRDMFDTDLLTAFGAFSGTGIRPNSPIRIGLTGVGAASGTCESYPVVQLMHSLAGAFISSPTKLTSSGLCSTAPGSLRIVGGDGRSGRLEVFHDGVWGSVCADRFANVDARVACRQLGFSTGTRLAPSAVTDGHDAIWMDEVGCAGTETRLDACGFGAASCGASPWGCNDCTHARDVGVSCVP